MYLEERLRSFDDQIVILGVVDFLPTSCLFEFQGDSVRNRLDRLLEQLANCEGLQIL